MSCRCNLEEGPFPCPECEKLWEAYEEWLDRRAAALRYDVFPDDTDTEGGQAVRINR